MLLERSDFCRMRLEASLVGLERVGLLADQLFQTDLELLLSTLEVVAPARQPLFEPLLRLGNRARQLGPRDVELLGYCRATVLPQPALLLGQLVGRLGALAGKRVLELGDPPLRMRVERGIELLAHPGPGVLDRPNLVEAAREPESADGPCGGCQKASGHDR